MSDFVHNGQPQFEQIPAKAAIEPTGNRFTNSEFYQNMRAYAQASREDMRDMSIVRKIGGTATGVAFVLHEVGMEAAIGNVGARVFEASSNPILTGGAMAASSAVVETGLSLVVPKVIEGFNNLSDELRERHYLEGEDEARDAVDAAADFGTMITLGSPGMIIQEYARHPDNTYKENVKVGFKAVKKLALLNFGYGAVIGGGAWSVKALGVDITEGVQTVAESPITYLGLFTGSRVLSHFSRKAKKQANAEKHAASIAEQESAIVLPTPGMIENPGNDAATA